MKIKKYQNPSGSLPNPNIFQRPDGSYFYSNDGKSEINVIPLNKLTDNPAEWTYTDETGRVYTPKKEYKNTYTLTESNPIADYHNYLNLKDKSSRDKIMAKAYLENGNLYDAFMSYIGMKTPKNPFIITGEPSILPGRGINSKTVQNITKGTRTLEDYLRTTKVSAPKLEGTGHLRSNYATDRFLGGQIFESSLPEEAIRVQGHGMAKSPTIQDALARLRYILDNGFEKGKTFYTAPLKANKETQRIGSILGTGGGKPYFDGHFLITGKPGQMINSVDDISTIYINNAYQNEEALKAAQKLQQYLQKTYPKINFKLYSQGYKQGGKMNTLQFLKNGSGIHIKKKNRGKFTDYCGGKVTSECIARGKRSSDPAVRKRATFAANARKWKHKNGGKAFVEGVNVLDSNPKAYKYVKKKYKMRMAQNGTKVDWNSLANVGVNLLQGVVKNKQISEEAKVAKAMNKLTSRDFLNIYNQKLQEAKQQEEQQAKAVEAMTGTTINSSNIVAANNAWKNASGEYAALKNNVDQQNKIIDAQAQAQKSDVWGNAISNVMQQGMGMLNNYLNNKSNTTTPNISFNKKVDFGNIKTNFGQLGTYSTNSGYQPKQLSFDWSKVGIQ